MPKFIKSHDKNGRTGLMLAASRGLPDMIDLLCNYEAGM